MGQLNIIYFFLRKCKLNKVAVYLYVGQTWFFFSYATEICQRTECAPSHPGEKGPSWLQDPCLSLVSSNSTPCHPPLELLGPEVSLGPASTLIPKAQKFPRPLTSSGLELKVIVALPGRPLQLIPLVRRQQAEGFGKVGRYSCHESCTSDCLFPSLE